MGGELRDCGCFDGWPDPEATAAVAIRCPEHIDEPARYEGAPVFSIAEWRAPPKRRPPGRMAASIKTRRRR